MDNLQEEFRGTFIALEESFKFPSQYREASCTHSAVVHTFLSVLAWKLKILLFRAMKGPT